MTQASFDFHSESHAAFTQKAAQSLAKAFPENLCSVIIFGPAAVMDEEVELDEITLLVVFKELDGESMVKLRPWLKSWLASGCPMPLLFEVDRLMMSGESFALEILDMKEARQVLWGADPIPEIEVKPTHLLQQIEHELKSELHRIRDVYLRKGHDAPALQDALGDSLARLRLLMRATLRLYRPVCPRRNVDVLRALRVHISFDSEIISVIQSLNNARSEPLLDVAFLQSTMLRYIETVVKISDAVDGVKNRRQRMMVL